MSYAESAPRRSFNLNTQNATSVGGASRMASTNSAGRSTRTAQAASSGAFDTQQSGRSSGNASASSLTDSPNMLYDTPNNNMLMARRGAPTMLAPASFSRPKVVNQQGLMTGGTVVSQNHNNAAAGVGASAIRRMSSGSMPTMASSSASSSFGGVAKKGSKKRKKKSLGMGRSKSRKRIPSNFGPLHVSNCAA